MMLDGSPSRQARRALARGLVKARARKPDQIPQWGDRRLNRKGRFALGALLTALRADTCGLAGQALDLAVARAMLVYRLPEAIVREAFDKTGVGRVQLLEAAA